MRTSSIFVCLLSFIGLISFQQNCLSEIAPPDSPNEHKEKNIFDVGKQEFYLESLVARLDPSSVLRKPITRDTARLAWYLALIIAVLFSMLKLFRLMEGSAPLWTLKVPLILINVIVHPLIWILSLHSDYAKAFYLKEGSAFELMWCCLISIIWLGLNWIYVNQCASGSRVFLAQGILLTGLGLLIVSTAILNTTRVLATSMSIMAARVSRPSIQRARTTTSSRIPSRLCHVHSRACRTGAFSGCRLAAALVGCAGPAGLPAGQLDHLYPLRHHRSLSLSLGDARFTSTLRMA